MCKAQGYNREFDTPEELIFRLYFKDEQLFPRRQKSFQIGRRLKVHITTAISLNMGNTNPKSRLGVRKNFSILYF